MKAFSTVPFCPNVFTQALKKVAANAGDGCRLQFGLLLLDWGTQGGTVKKMAPQPRSVSMGEGQGLFHCSFSQPL